MISTPFLKLDVDPDLELLRDSVHRFAREKIAPRAADIDRDNDFPHEYWAEFGKLGFLGITAEEQYGGTNQGYLAQIIAMEEISRASASVGLSYAVHANLVINQMQLHANAEQKNRYL